MKTALAFVAFLAMICLPIYLIWNRPTRHGRSSRNVVKDMGGLGSDVPGTGSHHDSSHSGGHSGGDGGGSP